MQWLGWAALAVSAIGFVLKIRDLSEEIHYLKQRMRALEEGAVRHRPVNQETSSSSSLLR